MATTHGVRSGHSTAPKKSGRRMSTGSNLPGGEQDHGRATEERRPTQRLWAKDIQTTSYEIC